MVSNATATLPDWAAVARRLEADPNSIRWCDRESLLINHSEAFGSPTDEMLAVLAILIWHFYHVHLRGFNKSMFTGTLSEEEMREEHPLELEALQHVMTLLLAHHVVELRPVAVQENQRSAADFLATRL